MPIQHESDFVAHMLAHKLHFSRFKLRGWPGKHAYKKVPVGYTARTQFECTKSKRKIGIDLARKAIFRIVAWTPGGVAWQPLVLPRPQQLIDRNAFQFPLQVP